MFNEYLFIFSCDIVEISDFSQNSAKKEVFLTARVHPGETMASFVIEKIIQILLGNSQEARYLRKNCIFKVIFNYSHIKNTYIITKNLKKDSSYA